MTIGSNNIQAFKLNLKNIQIIEGVQRSQEVITTEVARIKSLAEQGYKETFFSDFNIIIKNAKKILNRPQANTHANCQIYLIHIDRLLDSISDLEPKLMESTLDNSNDIVLGLRDAVRHIGSVFSTQV